MGIFDQLVGAVSGGTPQAAGPTPNTALQSIFGLLNSPQVGGVAGLMKLFESHGLGHLVSGWVGTGPNPGVSAGQVSQVFGPDKIAQIASQLGVPPDQASQHLAQLLPHVVDHMTPDGTVPPTPDTPNASAAMFDLLKSKLLGG